MGQTSVLSTSQDITPLTQNGDPDAIANLLKEQFQSYGFNVKAGWKDNCLGILVEGYPIPEASSIVAQIKSALTEIVNASTHHIRIYGRLTGDHLPAWRRELYLSPTEQSNSHIFSVMDWLTQGDHLDEHSQSQQQPEICAEEQRFLEFRCPDGTLLLLPLKDTESVFKLSAGDILPIPHMPDSILGLYNYRGNLLWMVDLSMHLGQTTFLLNSTEHITSSELSAIAIPQADVLFGAVVSNILDIQTHAMTSVHPPHPHLFPANVINYLSGYIRDSGLPILNCEAIAQDIMFQVASH